jgi:hypothetical protein
MAQVFGKRMLEIRVCWKVGVCEGDDDELEVTEGGVWYPDTERNRRDLALVIAAGSAMGTFSSLWLEVRQA